MLESNYTFTLFPEFDLSRRLRFAGSVAKWLANRYNLDFEDVYPEAILSFYEESRLVDENPSLTEPTARPRDYWRAIKRTTERKIRPPRVSVNYKRKTVSFSELDPDSVVYEDKRANLLEYKDIINTILRRIEPTQYKILTRILTEALSDGGARVSGSDNIYLTAELSEELKRDYNKSVKYCRELLAEFIRACRNEYSK